MSDILKKICEVKAQEVAALQKRTPLAEIRTSGVRPTRATEIEAGAGGSAAR